MGRCGGCRGLWGVVKDGLGVVLEDEVGVVFFLLICVGWVGVAHSGDFINLSGGVRVSHYSPYINPETRYVLLFVFNKRNFSPRCKEVR